MVKKGTSSYGVVKYLIFFFKERGHQDNDDTKETATGGVWR